ncbi:unnamed protein product [Ixodes persulcatus]
MKQFLFIAVLAVVACATFAEEAKVEARGGVLGADSVPEDSVTEADSVPEGSVTEPVLVPEVLVTALVSAVWVWVMELASAALVLAMDSDLPTVNPPEPTRLDSRRELQDTPRGLVPSRVEAPPRMCSPTTTSLATTPTPVSLPATPRTSVPVNSRDLPDSAAEQLPDRLATDRVVLERSLPEESELADLAMASTKEFHENWSRLLLRSCFSAFFH